MKKNLLPIVIIIIVFAAIMAGGIFFWTKRHDNEGATYPTITKVESEDEDNDKRGSVDVSLQYAGYITLLGDEKIITLNFTNPSRSKKSLSLDIFAEIGGENVLLAKTDIIRPGYKIDSVRYSLDSEIPKGDYKGKFIVHFYNEQDEEEIINSEIAINVYVK